MKMRMNTMKMNTMTIIYKGRIVLVHYSSTDRLALSSKFFLAFVPPRMCRLAARRLERMAVP
jgi:hypothetical protein